MNLGSMLLINIVFQNQYAMLQNNNVNNINNTLYPPIMCDHSNLKSDFQYIFRHSFNTAMFQA